MALLLLGILLSCVSAGFCTVDVRSDVRVDFSPYIETWETFKAKYGRNYTAAEEAIRFRAFIDRLNMMESHNRDYLANRTSFYMDIVHFADEIEAIGSCESSSEIGTESSYQNGQSGPKFTPYRRPDYRLPPPASLDWRNNNAVTPVQNQGRCRSCYAFAVTASMEAQMHYLTNQLTPLSQQQQVDCLENGCRGSNLYIAFSYVYTARGLKTASKYPYTFQTREYGLPGPTCLFEIEEAQAQVTEVYYTHNERDLLFMVAYQGPSYISFRAQSDFMHYRGGVYSSYCEGPTNHALTVIGYGHDVLSGKDYWIVKNSWGTDWGMNGFGWIERGRNICGIGSLGAVPLVHNSHK